MNDVFVMFAPASFARLRNELGRTHSCFRPPFHEVSGTVTKTRALLILAVLFLAPIALAVAARSPHVASWLDPERLATVGAALTGSPWAWAWVTAAFVAAGAVMLPMTPLTAWVALVFPPLEAAGYALAGNMTSSALMFLAGRALGREAVRTLAGHRLRGVNALMGKRGVLATIMIRAVPAAPFGMVNLAAGTTRLGFLRFMAGNLLFFTPFTLVLVFLTVTAEESFRAADLFGAVSVVLIGAGGAALMYVLRTSLRRASTEEDAVVRTRE